MAKPCFTIFGGTGDLTFRKLLPALYNLSAAGTLPETHLILIIGRRDYSSEDYRTLAREWVERFCRLPYTPDRFDRFARQIEYFQMDFTDPGQYAALNSWYRARDVARSIYYFAVAPRFFPMITGGLAQIEGAREGKVILEKPFGESLEAAEALNARLEAFFGPERIYRIDHYLGKEMVRGLQTLRFANPVFTDAWDARHIACIQLTASEEVGVETRGGYYDQSGALKDMVQNHLFQLLSILAMEAPSDFTPEAMHTEQLNVLRALRAPDPSGIGNTLVLGQYEGYRSEPKVDPVSRTETYAALRLFVENERWRGVPFYIRTGKRLAARAMEVTVVFRTPAPEIPPCVLTLKIQPTEGVYLRFNIKRPGNFEEIQPVSMDFCQSCLLENRVNTPEAYERLLTACMRGERAWFSRWDQIETSWRYIDALRDAWREAGGTLFPYPPGSYGPGEADALLSHLGHHWIAP